MHDVSNLRTTIVPKSDQINSEQLLSCPMTITVTEVSVSASPEQPVTVHYYGDAGRPYKPCKTMRKLLVFAWGEDGRAWAGRSMTLYCDPAVRFGGDAVGGIRISHLSHIERDIEVSLTATRGKKSLYRVRVMQATDDGIDHASDAEELRAAFAVAYKAATSPAQKTAVKQRYEARKAAIQSQQEQ